MKNYYEVRAENGRLWGIMYRSEADAIAEMVEATLRTGFGWYVTAVDADGNETRV